jgi:hypothetical protein
MRSLDTGWIRRWLVWTAVSIATEAKSIPRTFGSAPRQAVWIGFRLLMLAGLIPLLGILATIDLFDQALLLPWMGDRATSYELATGAFFAVLIPVLIAGSLYFRSHLRPAALILGIAIAAFLHATLISMLLLLTYNALEATLDYRAGRGGINSKWVALRAWLILALAVVSSFTLVAFAFWLATRIGPDWEWDVPGAKSIALWISDRGRDIWELPRWYALVALAVLVGAVIKLKPPSDKHDTRIATRT